MEIDATFFSASKVVVSFEIQILEADLSLPLKDTLTALREFLAFLIPKSKELTLKFVHNLNSFFA
jgi:hypothetical protein